MRSPVSCGSMVTRCSSSLAPTSTALKCCRPRRRRSLPHSNSSNVMFRASRPWSSDSIARTTHSSAPLRGAITGRQSAFGSEWKRRATFTSTSIRAGTRFEMKHITTRTRLGSMGEANALGRKARRSNGSKRRAISSGFPLTSRSCSISTIGIPTLCCRGSASTRSSRSLRAACRISRSRAPPSIGASRCRAIRSTSCTCGSTRSRTTSRRLATLM